jgi:hypothetical protein
MYGVTKKRFTCGTGAKARDCSADRKDRPPEFLSHAQVAVRISDLEESPEVTLCSAEMRRRSRSLRKGTVAAANRHFEQLAAHQKTTTR